MRNKYMYLFLAGLLLLTMNSYAQNVAINEDGSLPNPNAILDIKSFNKGMLIPRVSTAGRLAIPNTKGLQVYDTTTNSFWYNTGIAWQNMAAASSGAGWLLHGNSGTDSSSFLGTTDFQPLFFRLNNEPAGRIDVLGLRSSVFLGLHAGTFSIGTENTGIGYEALKQNNTGIANVAIGTVSMTSNTTGSVNTVVGAEAFMFNTTGWYNSAYGYQAMLLNTAGNYNTAYGAFGLYGNRTGEFNTAIGYSADVSAPNLSNATAIGYIATVNASNKIRIGNSAITVIEGQVPFTTPSDGRFKYQVQEDVKGLDFILNLRPVTYQFNTKQFDTQQNSSRLKDTAYANAMQSMQAAYTEASNIRRSGFIAQEVEKAAAAAGYNFSGLIKPKTAKEYYSLSYESFVVPLVKAVQEQQKTIDAQNKKLADLQQQLNEIKKLLPPISNR